LESFSEEDQQIIREAAQEAVATVRKNNDDSAGMMEKDLTSKGMTIVPTNEVDSKAFQEVAKPVYEKMESYIGGTWVSDLEKEVESK
jgi:TRAP-type C4-dicarboxylate transport system substrate-binding protein